MQEILHGSSVVLRRSGLLILGPSGSGKSDLALRLMAFGADLVSDDRTMLTRPDDGPPLMEAPEPIRGMIEARGIGLLTATATRARLVLCIDLGLVERDRLPPRRVRAVLGCAVPLLHKPETGDVAAALVQYLRSGRCET